MITWDNLKIKYGTTNFGSEQADIRVCGVLPSGSDYARMFRLVSTKGLRPDKPETEPTFHLYEMNGWTDTRDGRDWHGVFETYDMSDAIKMFIDYMNELETRAKVEWVTMGMRSDLSTLVSKFDDALIERHSGDWLDNWNQVKAAVAAIEGALVEEGLL